MPMTPVLSTVAKVCAGALLAAACSRGKSDDASAWNGPAPHGPPPHPSAPNTAPLNNPATEQRVASTAARAEDRIIDLGRHATRLELRPSTGPGPTASAALEEVGGTVHMKVAVHHAPPGPLQIAVHERGPCTERYLEGDQIADAGPMRDAQQVVDFSAPISVGKNGNGKAELTVPDANLDARDERTLLGKALVIARAAHGASNPAALACAQIRDD